jgi:FAD/FMN-containing dehydrogenase
LYIPRIKGTVFEDEHTLVRYSTDMSGYTLQPSIVALPSNEEDVLRLFEYAKAKAIPITPRGAGSNLSGSAVGSGLVLHFKNMAEVIGMKDRLAVLEPGVYTTT